MRSSSCLTTCDSGAVASISIVAVARSRGSTSARYCRIWARSPGCFPYGLPVRAPILARMMSAGALSSAMWSNRE
jgi:hypothetical protein